ncbi:HK97 gp10 family phage protein [Xanthobacter sp. DSM 24535]|uniref:HK97 gp10 family phage protein n=1 Tax=Roseixanthobacter psychrophilus TaxID=3119917 RepID=UPI00372A6CC7
MPQQSFSAQVAAFQEQAEKKMRAVFRESAQDVVADMQTTGWSVASTAAAIAEGLGGKGRGKNYKPIQGPVLSAGEGGNMPVDTGFLRSSLQISIDGEFPSATRENPERVTHNYNPEPVNLLINGAEIGQTINAGYTAKYAPHVEYGARGRAPRRFVGLAAQRWQEIVNRVVARLNGSSVP